MPTPRRAFSFTQYWLLACVFVATLCCSGNLCAAEPTQPANTQPNVAEAPVYVCPANLTLSTQAQINHFATNYPGCIPTNSLVISGNNIVSLAGLSGMSGLLNNLTIKNNPLLTNLDGLNNITSTNNLIILNNASLTSLNGLGTMNVSSLTIEQNPALVNLTGLAAVGGEYGEISIINNPNLTSLEGLEGLTLASNVHIENNPVLANLLPLQSLYSATGITIVNCPALTNLDGLNNLVSLAFNLNILNNANLTDISAVTPVLLREYCEWVTTSNDDNENGGDETFYFCQLPQLVLLNNPLLSSCSVYEICHYLHSGGAAEISGNAPGCASISEINAACTPDNDNDGFPLYNDCNDDPATGSGINTGAGEYCDGIDNDCDLVIDGCGTPTHLVATNITATSATISWAGCGATSYTVEYLASTGLVTLSGITIPSVDLSDLLQGTNYSVMVKTDCSGDLYQSSFNFTTLTDCAIDVQPPVITCPASVNIQTIAPACTAPVTIQPAMATDLCGIASIISTPSGTTDFPLGTNMVIHTATDLNGNSITCTQTIHVYTPLEICNNIDDDCDGLIDDGLCAKPSGLSSADVTATSATLSWNNCAATSYQLRYRLQGTTAWTIAPYTTLKTLGISGLVNSKTYQYQVRAFCSGIWTPYSTAATFTTLPGCSTTYFTSSSVTNNAFTANWFAIQSNTGQRFMYKKSSASTWTLVNVPSANNTYTSPNTLLPNTAYQYRIAIKCGTAYLPYTKIYTITTAALLGSEDREIVPTEAITEMEVAPPYMDLHPNPATDAINIGLSGIEPTKGGTLRILDMLGKKLWEKRLSEADFATESIQVPLWAGFANGIYCVQFQGADGRRVIERFEIVKQ